MIRNNRKRKLDHNSLLAKDQLGGFGVGLVCPVAGRISRGDITTGVVVETVDDEPFTLEDMAGLMWGCSDFSGRIRFGIRRFSATARVWAACPCWKTGEISGSAHI